MRPNTWRLCSLSKVGTIKSGSTPERAQHERYFSKGAWPWVKTMDLTNGRIHSTDECITDAALSETACKLFPEGTVLVAMYGGFRQIGRTGVLSKPSAVNQAISAIDVDREVAEPMYVLQWLNAHVNTWKSFAASSRKDPNITRDDVCNFPIALPPLAEQRRIARLLNTWDDAIDATNKLLANSQEQLSIVKNLLLSGRRRLNPEAQWTRKQISELIVESRLPGSQGHEARKLTVKLYGKGVTGKSEKRLGSESTQYFRRTAGQFIYSKLDFLNGAFGLIPPKLDGYESTLDLPAFDFLPGVEPKWFLSFVSREEFYRNQLGLANGGRKARRVNPKDMLRINIDVPPIEEQRAIADAVSIAEQGVRCNEQALSYLRNEKSALMHQLFAGKRRVKLIAKDEAALT